MFWKRWNELWGRCVDCGGLVRLSMFVVGSDDVYQCLALVVWDLLTFISDGDSWWIS